MAFKKNKDGVMIPSDIYVTDNYTQWDRPAGTIDWSKYTGIEDYDPAKILNRFKDADPEVIKQNLLSQWAAERKAQGANGLSGLMGSNVSSSPMGGGGISGTLVQEIEADRLARKMAAEQNTPKYRENNKGLSRIPMEMIDSYGLKDMSQQAWIDELAAQAWEANKLEQKKKGWEANKKSTNSPVRNMTFEQYLDYLDKSSHPVQSQANIDKMTNDEYEKYARQEKLRNYNQLLKFENVPSLYTDVANKFGIKPEDVAGAFDTYFQGLSALDPVGANWQDLKTLPQYSDLLGEVQKRSPVSKAFATKLEEQIPNPDLPWQYYSWNTSDPTRPTEMSPYRDISGYNTQRNVGWSDFLPAHKAWQNATPEEVQSAKDAYKKYMEFSNKKTSEGGRFDIFKEVGKTPGKDWYRVDSPAANKFDTAQEFLSRESGGKKNYKDVGLDPNAAWKSGWEYDAPDSGGFFGGGGLGGLISAGLSIAGMFNPELSIASKIFGGVNALASGNPVGGALSLFSAVPGGMDSIVDTVGSKIGDITGLTDTMHNFDPTLLGKSAIGSVTGGLTGGGLGALTGGITPYSQDYLQSLGLSPALANSINKAGVTGLRYLTADTPEIPGQATQRTQPNVRTVNGVKFKNVNGVWVPA